MSSLDKSILSALGALILEREFVVAGDRIYQSDGLNFGLGLQGGTLAFPE